MWKDLLLEELILIQLPGLDDRGHVDLIVGREHGGSVLRILQTLANPLAHPRHGHPSVQALSRRPSSRSSRLGGSGSLGGGGRGSSLGRRRDGTTGRRGLQEEVR